MVIALIKSALANRFWQKCFIYKSISPLFSQCSETLRTAPCVAAQSFYLWYKLHLLAWVLSKNFTCRCCNEVPGWGLRTPLPSAHCVGIAFFIKRPQVATLMFISFGRKKFLPEKVFCFSLKQSCIQIFHTFDLLGTSMF